MRRTKYLFLGCFTIALAVGCQAILGIDETSFAPDSGVTSGDSGTNDGTTSGDSAPSDAGSPSLSISPANVRVVPGTSTDIDVTIVRAGIAGDVTISADDLDAGVGIAPITIADGASTGKLHVTVSPSAKPGSQDIASVHASLAGAASVPLTIAIPGPPGTVDTTFANGEAAFAVGSAGVDAVGIAVGVQSDGKVIIGTNPGTSASGWAVLRLDASGVLDATFNTNAAAAMPGSGALHNLLVGLHDDIFAVGDNGSQLTVVHLNADGTRDNAFGTNGIAALGSINFSQGSSGTGVGVQSDGRPIVVGNEGPSGSPTPIVVRFGTDGTWDQTFGGSGHAALTTNQGLTDVVVLADDRIAASGRDVGTPPPHQIVAHLTKDGEYDDTFSDAGFVRGGGDVWSGADIAFAPDAGFVVVGMDSSAIGGCAVTQFATVGDASTFGVESYPVTNNARCTAVATQTDNRYLITGFGGGSFSHYTWVLRLTAPTTLDPTFNDGGSGVVFFADHSINPSAAYRSFFDVAIAPDGRVVAVGNQDSAGVMVVRIWP